PPAARGVPRALDPSAGRRDDRARDRRPHRPDAGIGAGEPASRNAHAARAARPGGGLVSDDYLWDGAGRPDSEVARLERVLSPLRSHRPAPELPAAGRRSFGGRLTSLAAAASVLLAVSGLWLAHRRPEPSWEVTRLETTPSGDTVAGVERLRVGQWLETGRTSIARLAAGAVGQVEA